MSSIPNHSGCGRSYRLLIAGCALAAALDAAADSLSLAGAEALALQEAPALHALDQRRTAMEELAVAGEQLPDPMLRAGFLSLPTDSWNLGQEPMTQAVIGVTQKFPRGHSRSLRAEQMREQAGERQVAGDIPLGLTHNVGGTGGTCAVHIYERRN